MGGRGSGGGKSGGGASKFTSISKETEDKINQLLNLSYKNDDFAYEKKQQARMELAMAEGLRKNGKIEQAEKYENYAKQSMKAAVKAENDAKAYVKQANQLAPQKVVNIPRSYSYKGEEGSRSVYKSLQTAKQHWKERNATNVSTANMDAPTIVIAPTGGYSVMPRKIARINKLTEISPYRIKDTD